MSDTETETKERVVKTPETEEEKAERIAKQEEVDSRSIYVGNVDYQSTPEQLEELFREVGVIERVTILFDKYSGLPKGYAYIEFETVDSVEKSIEELHGKTFRGREIRVTAKRTNLPGFKRRGGFRGGRGFRGGARGFRGGARGRGGYRGRGGRGRGGKGDGEVEGETSTESESVPAEKPETAE